MSKHHKKCGCYVCKLAAQKKSRAIVRPVTRTHYARLKLELETTRNKNYRSTFNAYCCAQPRCSAMRLAATGRVFYFTETFLRRCRRWS